MAEDCVPRVIAGAKSDSRWIAGAKSDSSNDDGVDEYDDVFFSKKFVSRPMRTVPSSTGSSQRVRRCFTRKQAASRKRLRCEFVASIRVWGATKRGWCR